MEKSLRQFEEQEATAAAKAKSVPHMVACGCVRLVRGRSCQRRWKSCGGPLHWVEECLKIGAMLRSDFKRYLLEKYGSLEAAWRRGRKVETTFKHAFPPSTELNPFCSALVGFQVSNPTPDPSSDSEPHSQQTTPQQKQGRIVPQCFFSDSLRLVSLAAMGTPSLDGVRLRQAVCCGSLA